MLATVGDLTILVVSLVILGIVVAIYVNSIKSNTAGIPKQIPDTCDTALQMQKLWLDHYYYTRMAIIEYTSGYEGAGATIDRLYKNQEEIGAFIGTFAGVGTGNELTRLLKEHIDIAIEIVKAAAAAKSISTLYTSWLENAYKIAALIHTALPSTSLQTLQQSLKMHLDTTVDEATAILNKKYENSIVKGDIAENHIVDMSNYISSFL